MCPIRSNCILLVWIFPGNEILHFLCAAIFVPAGCYFYGPALTHSDCETRFVPQSCGNPTVILRVLAGGQVFYPRDSNLNEFILNGLVTHSFRHCAQSTVLPIQFYMFSFLLVLF